MRRLTKKLVVACVAFAISLTCLGCTKKKEAERAPTAPQPAREIVTVTIPEPLSLKSDKVVGYVVIPNIDALLDQLEEIARSFAPEGQVMPGMLKALVGARVGDANLTNLNKEKPIVLMVLAASEADQPPSVAAFIPVLFEGPYEQALAMAGMQTKLVKDDILVAAKTADALASAESLLSAYSEIESAGVDADLRVFLEIGRLIDVYGSTIQTQIDAMAGTIGMMAAMSQSGQGPDPAQIVKILKLEVKVILALLEQVEAVQTDVSLDTDAITVRKIFAARSESPLAELLAARAGVPRPALGLLPESGAVTASVQYDPEEVSDFVVQLLKELEDDPDAAEFLTPEIVAVYEEMDEAWRGDGAMTMSPGEGSPFLVHSAMGIKDEGECLEMIEKNMGIMAPGTGLGKMLEGMGIAFTMALEKDVREHAGVSVHRQKVDMEMENLPEAQAEQMKAFMKQDTEFAFAKGYYLTSQDPAVLDSMIDKALAGQAAGGATLDAMEEFGKGRCMYADIDMIGLVKAGMEAAPMAAGMPGPAKAIFDDLTSTEPIVVAGASGEGRGQVEVKIPLGPFVEIAKKAQPMAPGMGAGTSAPGLQQMTPPPGP